MNDQTKAHILIVEDDRDLLEVMSDLLETEGYQIAQAADGAEALELLRAGLRPDLILLDLQMPRMSGWRFRLEQLRDPELAEIPVLVMTVWDEELGSCSADGYLIKPLTLEALLQSIERYRRHYEEPSLPA
jgi:CheY-like chemotaxis protein